MPQDRTKNTCRDCHFWERHPDQPYTSFFDNDKTTAAGKPKMVRMNSGTCHRYPEASGSGEFYWCGEFTPSLEAVVALKDAIDKTIAEKEKASVMIDAKASQA